MSAIKNILNSRYFIWAIIALPSLLMLNIYLRGNGVYADLMHGSGEFSARLLVLSLIISPFRLMFPKRSWPGWLMQRRRYFGVGAFWYALVHTVFYLGESRELAVILAEAPQLGIWTGWIAFFIFVPLAVTSNDTSVRLLKRKWNTLHRYVYAAAVLTLAHWAFIHLNVGPALVHFVPLAALEIYRIVKLRARKAQHASPA